MNEFIREMSLAVDIEMSLAVDIYLANLEKSAVTGMKSLL